MKIEKQQLYPDAFYAGVIPARACGYNDSQCSMVFLSSAAIGHGVIATH